MSNSGDIPELQDLEPIESPAAPEVAMQARPASDAQMQQLRNGLPAPAYNPRADKFYFRFLFCGLLMLIGCLMPFGPQLELAGYKTLGGAFCMLIAIGMVWTWWGAINLNHAGGANIKWTFLCILPLFVQFMNLRDAFSAPAVAAAIEEGVKMDKDWGGLFSSIGESLAIFSKTADPVAAGLRVDNFFHFFGPGKVLVFFGALFAEVVFVWSLFGAAKQMKQDKIAKQAAAAERRRR